MSTCIKCGTGILPNSIFCIECGTRVEPSHPDQSPQQYHHPPPPQSQQYHQPPQASQFSGQPSAYYPTQPQSYSTQYQYGQQPQAPPYPHQYPQQRKIVREPGRKMIFVVSILLIIFGAFGVLSSISSIFTTSFMASIYPSSVMDSWFVVVLSATVSSILMLAFGIGSNIMSKDSKKANTIMIFGVILLVFIFANSLSVFIMVNDIIAFIADDIFGYFSNGFYEFIELTNTMVVVGTVIGTISNSVLPVLLIIGAWKRKKNA